MYLNISFEFDHIGFCHPRFQNITHLFARSDRTSWSVCWLEALPYISLNFNLAKFWMFPWNGDFLPTIEQRKLSIIQRTLGHICHQLVNTV